MPAFIIVIHRTGRCSKWGGGGGGRVKCAVAFESRDSLMMRMAVRWRFTMDYEVDAVSADGKRGGVADSGIPNFYLSMDRA